MITERLWWSWRPRHATITVFVESTLLPRIVDHLTVEVNNKVAGDLGYELCYHVGIEPPHWDYHEIDRIKSIRQKGNIGGVYLNVKCCKGTEQNEDIYHGPLSEYVEPYEDTSTARSRDSIRRCEP